MKSLYVVFVVPSSIVLTVDDRWYPLFSFKKVFLDRSYLRWTKLTFSQNRDDTPSKPQVAEPDSQKARPTGKKIQDVKTEELKETDTVIA